MPINVINLQGPNIRACLAYARKKWGLKLRDSREELRSGGEDGLYRVHLQRGYIVECTIRQHARVTD
jgi:hypothetical protein